MSNLSGLFQRIFVVSLIAVFFTDANVFANPAIARLENPVCQLKIEHLSGKIVIDGKETKVTPKRPAKIRLRRGTAVEVLVVDYNPLLFTYNDSVNVENSQDYENFKKFKASFTKALDKINSTSTANAVGDAASKGSLSVGSSADNNFDKEPSTTIETIKACVNKIDEYLQKRADVVDLTNGTEAEVVMAKDLVKDWDLKTISKNFSDNIDKIKKQALSDDALSYKTYDALNRENEFKQIVAGLNDFVVLVNKVHTAFKLNDTVETLDTRKMYKMTISVEPNTTYRKIMSDAAKGIQDSGKGEQVIVFEREAFVRYSLASGVVYSFVENPSFSVKEDSDGKRTISKTSTDYKEFSGAVMLNVIPERLFESSFEPFMQFGASADGHNVGLLLGAGVSFFSFPNDSGDTQRSLTLSGGMIWQEVNRLANGLAVGGSIKSDSELKTDKGFENGLYVMIGVDF